jgi:ABC-type dipeptide/oligopeptide/nickel transport system permease subunit
MGIAVVQTPGITRIVYSATRQVSVQSYVEAAVVRGERTSAILRRDIFPNILGPVLANFGLTLTTAVLLVAAINFLGLGLNPPAANWGLMISENRTILSANVWATVAPAIMIVVLTLGVNLLGDAISFMLGRSPVSREEEQIVTLAAPEIEP